MFVFEAGPAKAKAAEVPAQLDIGEVHLCGNLLLRDLLPLLLKALFALLEPLKKLILCESIRPDWASWGG